MNTLTVTIMHISGRRTGTKISCTTWPITIGRAHNNLVQLDPQDTRASARHAQLEYDGTNVYLHDLESTNGTFLHGRRIARIKIKNGDLVEFGIGGPQLQFDFIKQSSPVEVESVYFSSFNEIPSTELVKIDPTNPASTPVPQVFSSTSHLVREFPLKNKYRFLFHVAGILFFGLSIITFTYNLLLLVVPCFLFGFFLMLTGWGFSRINITINAQGIEYQGLLKQYLIPWKDIIELCSEKSKTRILTYSLYTIKSPKKTLTFRMSGYTDGLELTQLIARRTGQQWK